MIEILHSQEISQAGCNSSAIKLLNAIRQANRTQKAMKALNASYKINQNYTNRKEK